MIQALTKIHDEDITHLDRAMMNFKKALAGMVMRANDNSIFGPNATKEQVPVLTERYTNFIAKTVAFADKAMELQDEA